MITIFERDGSEAYEEYLDYIEKYGKPPFAGPALSAEQLEAGWSAKEVPTQVEPDRTGPEATAAHPSAHPPALPTADSAGARTDESAERSGARPQS